MTNARITDVLPGQLAFVSANRSGTYNATNRTVTWNLGSVPAKTTASVTVTVKIASGTPGTAIVNKADFTGDLTVATPTAVAK